MEHNGDDFNLYNARDMIFLYYLQNEKAYETITEARKPLNGHYNSSLAYLRR
jgi:hypothetical protein